MLGGLGEHLDGGVGIERVALRLDIRLAEGLHHFGCSRGFARIGAKGEQSALGSRAGGDQQFGVGERVSADGGQLEATLRSLAQDHPQLGVVPAIGQHVDVGGFQPADEAVVVFLPGSD
ncbi:hypothetical protein FQZ97_917070 [compost metagenome]